MQIHKLTLGVCDTNCYIVDLGKGNGLVIDPADNARYIVDAAMAQSLRITSVVLTHGHFDHMLAVDGLGVQQVHIHQADMPRLRDPALNLSVHWMKGFMADSTAKQLSDGQDVEGFCVLHTPGHSPGSICLYNAQEKILFSGDTLFAGARGRTDFPEGDETALLVSLRKLLALPKDTMVYPGHGEPTTIGAQVKVFDL